MKISILASSMRDNAESLRVAEYLSKQLQEAHVDNVILDLNKKRLPIYDDTNEGSWKEMWQETRKLLEESDGFIFVSPEWDGMFSVGLHNMFHYTDKELADKPVLPVGVSSGRGGRYPLMQMRIMGYKNKRFVIIPESLFFENIEKSLVDEVFTDERDTERADYALKVLVEYTKALKAVRESGTLDYKKFGSGL